MDPAIELLLLDVSSTARARNLRIAVAESLTCGRLAHTIGAADSASEFFLGGATVYRMEAKARVLGVDTSLDPTSAECARQLAAGALRVYGADAAVSTTGVGGPDPEDGHPPGTVFVGWADGSGAGAVGLALEGEPDEILDQTIAAAVRLLAERLA